VYGQHDLLQALAFAVLLDGIYELLQLGTSVRGDAEIVVPQDSPGIASF